MAYLMLGVTMAYQAQINTLHGRALNINAHAHRSQPSEQSMENSQGTYNFNFDLDEFIIEEVEEDSHNHHQVDISRITLQDERPVETHLLNRFERFEDVGEESIEDGEGRFTRGEREVEATGLEERFTRDDFGGEGRQDRITREDGGEREEGREDRFTRGEREVEATGVGGSQPILVSRPRKRRLAVVIDNYEKNTPDDDEDEDGEKKKYDECCLVQKRQRRSLREARAFMRRSNLESHSQIFPHLLRFNQPEINLNQPPNLNRSERPPNLNLSEINQNQSPNLNQSENQPDAETSEPWWEGGLNSSPDLGQTSSWRREEEAVVSTDGPEWGSFKQLHLEVCLTKREAAWLFSEYLGLSHLEKDQDIPLLQIAQDAPQDGESYGDIKIRVRPRGV